MCSFFLLPKEPAGKMQEVELKESVYAFNGEQYLYLFDLGEIVMVLKFSSRTVGGFTYMLPVSNCAEGDKLEFAALIIGERFGSHERIDKEQWFEAYRTHVGKMDLNRQVL